jgi:general secretion pathway protein L
VAVVGEGEHALRCARSTWNLRQFDLAPSRRGTRAASDLWRRLLGPAWRPARIGLAGFVLVQLVGMNAWAWQQRQSIGQRRQAQEALLRSAFPNVRAVLDAPAQMTRETDQLRTAAGRPGADDLEAMLAAAASAWPDAQAPAQQLRFEPGRLTLAAPGWGEPQLQQFRERLRPGGWRVDSADGRVTMSRAAGAAS